MKVERIIPGERMAPQRRRQLEGAVLTRDLVVEGERWAKGRRLSAQDLPRLASGAPEERPITVLIPDASDLHEDDAARRLAEAVRGTGLAMRDPIESRLDLMAEHDGLVHVRTTALERVNRIDPLEVFTRMDGQVVQRGEVVASIKIAPHVVPAALVEQAIALCGQRGLVRVAPFMARRVGVLVKQSLHAPARERFEQSVRQKVEALASSIGPIEYVADEPRAVRQALSGMVTGADRVDLVLTAGSASTDPLDPFFVAIDELGGSVFRHGVPAHPGSMLWLARVDRTDVMGLPTCGAYAKATAADLLLPRLLSGERADARTVARLGHGGVLTREMRFRMPPYARDLEAPDG